MENLMETALAIYEPDEIIEEDDFLTDDEEIKQPRVSKMKVLSIDVEEDLSEEDLRELAVEIVNIDMEIKSKNVELETLKSHATNLKKTIDSLNLARIEKSSDYDYGKKSRTYSCYRRENYELGVYEYVHINTGIIVKTETFEEGDLFSVEE